MHSPGGRELAPDYFHLPGPPVAKVPIAKRPGALQQRFNFCVTPRLESPQGDVPSKSFRLSCRGEWPHRFVQLPVQLHQWPVVSSGARPDHPRLLGIGEKSDAMRRKSQGRATGTHARHGLFQCLNLPRQHIAKKFQRHVKLFRSRPADGSRRSRAPQLALSPADFLPHLRWDRQRNEQAQKRGWIVVRHQVHSCRSSQWIQSLKLPT